MRLSENKTSTGSPGAALEETFSLLSREIEILHALEDIFFDVGELAEDRVAEDGVGAVEVAADALLLALGDSAPSDQAAAFLAALEGLKARAEPAAEKVRGHTFQAFAYIGDALGRYAQARLEFLHWASQLRTEIAAGAVNEVAWRDRQVAEGLSGWDDVRIELPWEPAPERLADYLAKRNGAAGAAA